MLDLGAFIEQAAGTYLVLDVPVGTTTVTVTAGDTARERTHPSVASEVI